MYQHVQCPTTECSEIHNASVYLIIHTNAELIEVGFEFTEYHTLEEATIELCIVAISHSGGTPRPFILNFTTENGNAGRCVHVWVLGPNLCKGNIIYLTLRFSDVVLTWRTI